MNLLNEPWIPVRRASGQVERIRPADMTSEHEADPIVAIATGRADFNASLVQFLIGLIQTTCTPGDDIDWAEWLEEPPEPAMLNDRLKKLGSAFELDSGDHRFLQDSEDFETKSHEPVSSLLIDAPGGNTLKNNAAFFVKPGRISAMCMPCAATALFTLQTNAPSGGAGYRTSLRGGGPLTTLAVLDPVGESLSESLWRNVWLNVLERHHVAGFSGDLEKGELHDIFPWLASTRTSQKSGVATHPEDAHPMQMYWNMPRRIRLIFDDSAAGSCDICGATSDRLVTQFKTKNYGINYEGAWQHPLSPYRIDPKTGLPICVHPRPGGLTYRHWLNWMIGDEANRPALVIASHSARKLPGAAMRIWVFGYDMDNMKARCWYETTFPLYTIETSLRAELSDLIRLMTATAEESATAVRTAVKESWFKRPADVSGDMSFVQSRFYDATQALFLQKVHETIAALESGGNGVEQLRAWHSEISRAAFRVFDGCIEMAAFEVGAPRRIVNARDKLARRVWSKKIAGALHVKRNKQQEVAANES